MFKTYRSFHPNVRARLIINLLSNLASNMVFPFMAIYLSGTVGINIAGLTLTFAILLNVVSNILGGYLADSFGRKKTMIVSEFIRLLSYSLLLLGNLTFIDSPQLIVVGFLLSNVCSGFFTPASDAMLLDVTDSKDRRIMYSYMYWIMNLSMAVGGTLGALLFSKYLVQLCIALVVASTINLIIILVRITETNKESTEQNNSIGIKQNLKQMLYNYSVVWKDRIFLIYICAFVLVFSMESHFGNYIAVRFEQHVGQFSLYPINSVFKGVEMFGFLRLENTLLVVLFSFLSVKLLKKWTEKGWLFLGVSLYIIGFCSIVFVQNPWLLFFFMGMAVFGETVFAPIYETFLGEIPPKELRSTYMAVNSIALKLSMLIGSTGIFFIDIVSKYTFATFLLLTGLVALTMIKFILPYVSSKSIVSQTGVSEIQGENSSSM